MLSGNHYTVPKLQTFSKTDKPQKCEVKYEVWNFEVANVCKILGAYFTQSSEQFS